MNISGTSRVSFLKDNYGRIIDYLRLAVTDRCNLRCQYCMPEEGIQSVLHDQILTYEEALRLINIFSGLGIKKLRITGGEPFVRKGLIKFIESVSKLNSAPAIHITTNGVLLRQYLSALKELGISGINLSLDTLDKEKFKSITKRDFLSEVLKTLYEIINLKIPVKINTVVSEDFNTDEISNIAAIAKDKDVEVRFIEQMPFNGKSRSIKFISSREILSILQKTFNEVIPLYSNSTANLFSIPGFKGKIGLIQSYSRLFCNSCNRIRITSTGMLKTCLYDNGVLDLREMLRINYSDYEIKEAIIDCVNRKFKNGFEAENILKVRLKNSMASIGG